MSSTIDVHVLVGSQFLQLNYSSRQYSTNALYLALFFDELLVFVETVAKCRRILALVLALFLGAFQRSITLVVDTVAATLRAAMKEGRRRDNVVD